MKNFVKLFLFLLISISLTKCYQSVGVSKEDITAELKAKLRKDADFKQSIHEDRRILELKERNYFNEDEKSEAYIQANAHRINKGEKKAVYEEAGLKHVDEYLAYLSKQYHYTVKNIDRYKNYREKLSQKEYVDIFIEIENELVPPVSVTND
jgi:hypothetical protein